MGETATGLTYADLAGFPDDDLRRELFEGELVVTPAPTPPHQRVAFEIAHRLRLHLDVHGGGEVFMSPVDVKLSESTVLEPDVLFVAEGRDGIVGEVCLTGPPDLVVEVSSPSTRGRDRGRKRGLYERFEVAEYWFVDLEEEVVEVCRLGEGGYGTPQTLGRGQVVATPLLPGLELAVAVVLDAARG